MAEYNETALLEAIKQAKEMPSNAVATTKKFKGMEYQDVPGYPYIFEEGKFSAFGPQQIQTDLITDVKNNLSSLMNEEDVPEGFTEYLSQLEYDTKMKRNAGLGYSRIKDDAGKLITIDKSKYGPLLQGSISTEQHQQFYPLLASLGLKRKIQLIPEGQEINVENIARAWHSNPNQTLSEQYGVAVREEYEKIIGADIKPDVKPTPDYTPVEPETKQQTEEVFTLDYPGELPDIGEDAIPMEESTDMDMVSEGTDEDSAINKILRGESATQDIESKADEFPEKKSWLQRLLGYNEGGAVVKQQMDQMLSPDDMMLDSEPVTPEKLAEGKQAAKEIFFESFPGIGEAASVGRVKKALEEKDYVGAGIETAAGVVGMLPLAGDIVGKGIRQLRPKKTVKAYKLFTKGKDGNLYPLFVDADTPIKQGEFISAVIPDSVFTAPNGKKYVPSRGTGGKKGTGDSIKIPDQETRDLLIAKGFLPEGSKANSVKAVALRPGWHAGDSPAAPHIGNEYKGQKYRGDNQVWAEVEMPADIDWQAIANKRASKKKDGTINVKTAQITEELPSGGYYRYKTNPNMQGNWLISGEMKVNRILEPDEVKRLNKEAGTADLPTLSELKAKQFNNLTVQGVVALEARTAQSQAFRKRLLDSKDEMKKYAAEREISVEEMSSLIKNNYKNNKEILEDVREYMATDSFKNKQKTQKEKVKSLSFKNLDMAKGGVTMDDYQFAELELNKRQSFAEGGMAKQMEMFEDGGLMDEGGMVDEESGNEVPPGSLREEVRDDIPAQLSEGEFVFPADVVRYWGLEKLMEMRQEAKAGLARMEAMGQMGNSDEAVLPDDIPFSLEDLDMEDEEEYNMAVGGFVPNQFGIYQQPSQFATYAQQPYQPPTGPTLPTVPSTQQPIQTGFTPVTTPVTPSAPTFEQLLPTTTGRYDELREYENKETGQKMTIPFVDGKPIYPIPTGFTPVEKDIVEAATPETADVPTAQVDKGEASDRVTVPGTFQISDPSNTVNGQKTFGLEAGTGTDVVSMIDMETGQKVGLDEDAVQTLAELGFDATGISNKSLSAQTNFMNDPRVQKALAPHIDRLNFQNEIASVQKTKGFKELSDILDPRSIVEKAADVVKDAITGSTTTAEYDKLTREVATNIANYTDSPEEADKLADRIREYMEKGKKTRTELGMEKAPVVSGEDYDAGRPPSKPSGPEDYGAMSPEDVASSLADRGNGNNNSGSPSGDTGVYGGGSPGGFGVGTYGGGNTGGFNKGGLANKKPKPKKMKRGGLASKK